MSEGVVQETKITLPQKPKLLPWPEGYQNNAENVCKHLIANLDILAEEKNIDAAAEQMSDFLFRNSKYLEAKNVNHLHYQSVQKIVWRLLENTPLDKLEHYVRILLKTKTENYFPRERDALNPWTKLLYNKYARACGFVAVMHKVGGEELGRVDYKHILKNMLTVHQELVKVFLRYQNRTRPKEKLATEILAKEFFNSLHFLFKSVDVTISDGEKSLPDKQKTEVLTWRNLREIEVPSDFLKALAEPFSSLAESEKNLADGKGVVKTLAGQGASSEVTSEQAGSSISEEKEGGQLLSGPLQSGSLSDGQSSSLTLFTGYRYSRIKTAFAVTTTAGVGISALALYDYLKDSDLLQQGFNAEVPEIKMNAGTVVLIGIALFIALAVVIDLWRAKKTTGENLTTASSEPVNPLPAVLVGSPSPSPSSQT